MKVIEDSSLSLWMVAVGGTTTIVLSLFFLRSKPKSSKPKATESWESKIPPDQHHDGSSSTLQELYPKRLYQLTTSGCSQGPPTRNMTIYVCSNKKLVIYNGIAVREELLQDILQLGRPTILVVPNFMHRDGAAVWKNKFPDLHVVCPACAVQQVQEVVEVDQTIQDWAMLDSYWKDYVLSREIPGWAPFECVLEVQLGDSRKALMVTDLLFTIPYNESPGMMERIMMWIFDTSIHLPTDGTIVVPTLSRIAINFTIQDKKAVAEWFQWMAKSFGDSIAVITTGHGVPVLEVKPSEGCSEALLGVAKELM